MATSSSDDTAAATWRDLADQLTPEQVAYIELSEQHPVPNADWTYEAERQGYLFAAREMIDQNRAAVIYRHVLRPALAGRHLARTGI